MRKVSVGESFTVAVICGSEKVYGQEGGGEYQDFPSKIFCLTVPKISVAESFTVALILRRKGLGRRRGIKIFRRKNFVSQCRKVRTEILYCCISFGYRKNLDKRGEYQDFPSKILCLIVPKISVAESFTVALISGIKKVWMGGGSIKIFR